MVRNALGYRAKKPWDQPITQQNQLKMFRPKLVKARQEAFCDELD
jgi:hypothetical protein